MKKLTIEIVFCEEDNVYFAKALELPGCATEGDTLKEAIDMINDAIELWLSTAAAFKGE